MQVRAPCCKDKPPLLSIDKDHQGLVSIVQVLLRIEISIIRTKGLSPEWQPHLKCGSSSLWSLVQVIPNVHVNSEKDYPPHSEESHYSYFRHGTCLFKAHFLQSLQHVSQMQWNEGKCWREGKANEHNSLATLKLQGRGCEIVVSLFNGLLLSPSLTLILWINTKLPYAASMEYSVRKSSLLNC